MQKKYLFGMIVVCLSVVFLSGCEKEEQGQQQEDMQIANPASHHCIEVGGKLDIRTGPSGGEIGYCIFNDGSECEEWKFFRDECKKGENKK
jgi:hypothetical protein